ncbi:TPA: site-specific DNA-methyltransferase [Streptococcus pneumoniae]|nr:site-specific DNA-methyltransferase [Streptococcus pneumoniae]MDS8082378.1 site-specific DNA-methyltransferase [Streptococcus pneumoniae]MDT6056763.1 site-specific DNA-methyltransferase [Streptococcus pneumoniae]VPC02448.1 adenine-specific methyltransferase [Streptococcus pneumoniae]VRA26850.1 adenine-specific methyltransferase [Streptococcus pneumoniae]
MEIDKIIKKDVLEVMATIPDNKIDLIVTDPPYLINYKTNWRKEKHKFSNVIKNDNNPELIKECYRILKDDTAIYIFCSFDKVDFFKKEIEKYFSVKNIIIWRKNNHTAGDLEAQFGKQYEMIILANKGRKKFNGERLTDVWDFKRVSSDKLLHQNQKPIELIKRCIVKHSDVGDIVFDGFMGSGTTALAALETDRHFIGAEIDGYYFGIAEERIKNHNAQLSLFDEV